MSIDYKKEFFDREYSAREAYARVWRYARKYRFRIFTGIVCGMLTAGTLLPLFQVIQPALEKVGANEARGRETAEIAAPAAALASPPAASAETQNEVLRKKHGIVSQGGEARGQGRDKTPG